MGIVNCRQAILVCALGAMSESLVYTALAPLLDQLDGAEGFNHGQAGLLVAGYAIGYWLGSLPAYRLVARIGSRATATLGIASVAVATLLFAYGDSFPTLMGARVLVGTGSVVAYTGVLTAAGAVAGHDGRGAAIGTVYSGSAAGSAVGPLFGSLASQLGRGPVFTAVAAGQLLIALLLSRLPATSPGPLSSPRAVVRHLQSPLVRIGLWITSVPGFALGVLTVSGTYRLHELQAGSFLVALAFSGIAILNIVLAPRLGRASDRLGRRQPLTLALAVATIAIALIAATAVQVSTVVLIAIAGAFMLAVAGPGLALIGDGIRQDNGDPAGATLLMNVFWGPAAALGSITAGLVHGAYGVMMSLLMLTAVAVASIAAVRRYVSPDLHG
jgi:predicted MFS family arabinose efflux permease